MSAAHVDDSSGDRLKLLGDDVLWRPFTVVNPTLGIGTCNILVGLEVIGSDVPREDIQVVVYIVSFELGLRRMEIQRSIIEESGLVTAITNAVNARGVEQIFVLKIRRRHYK